MPIRIVKSSTAAIDCAHRIAEVIRAKPTCVLGLATGSTPIPVYQELIRMHKEEGLSFSRVTTFNLDEYVGLPATHDQSYRYFMEQQLFNHIDIKPENIHFPNGMASNLDEECKRYEHDLRTHGPVDIWLLGIGNNGHIAFNEPGSPEDSRTRRVALTESTIQANARFFGNDPAKVPKYALSSGIATIMSAREIVLLATGSAKACAVHRALNESPSTAVPASLLQHHQNTTFFIDQEAGCTDAAACPAKLDKPFCGYSKP